MEGPSVPNQPTGSTSVRGGVVNTRDEYQERLKKLTEAQRKVKEEKKKIADQVMKIRHILPAHPFKGTTGAQIMYDRRETGQREAKSSVSPFVVLSMAVLMWSP